MEETPFRTKKRRPERIFTAENERNLSTGCLPLRFCGPKSGLLPGTGADFMRLSIHAEVLFSPFNTGGYAGCKATWASAFLAGEAARENS